MVISKGGQTNSTKSKVAKFRSKGKSKILDYIKRYVMLCKIILIVRAKRVG